MFQKVLIFVLFGSGMVLAQFRTASLSGTIADGAEMPLGGVGIQVTFLTPSRDFVGPTLVRKVWSGLTKEDGHYRVRVGPFDTREDAQRVASNVQSRFPQQIPDYWIVSY